MYVSQSPRTYGDRPGVYRVYFRVVPPFVEENQYLLMTRTEDDNLTVEEKAREVANAAADEWFDLDPRHITVTTIDLLRPVSSLPFA